MTARLHVSTRTRAHGTAACSAAAVPTMAASPCAAAQPSCFWPRERCPADLAPLRASSRASACTHRPSLRSKCNLLCVLLAGQAPQAACASWRGTCSSLCIVRPVLCSETTPQSCTWYASCSSARGDTCDWACSERRLAQTAPRAAAAAGAPASAGRTRACARTLAHSCSAGAACSVASSVKELLRACTV